MIGPAELMRLHVAALFTLNGAGRLLSVNEPGGGPAPRFFIGRTADGDAVWFRHDVDAALAADLGALGTTPSGGDDVARDRIDPAPFLARLSRVAPVGRVWAGPVFRFPPDLPLDTGVVHVTAANATLLAPYLMAWIADAAEGVPVMAALEDGAAVSVCCSVRVTERAHEAGVITHPYFRGRGFGVRTVAAWAAAVRAIARIPLYSTSWENRASRAVAGRLGLIRFGEDLHIT